MAQGCHDADLGASVWTGPLRASHIEHLCAFEIDLEWPTVATLSMADLDNGSVLVF